MQACSLGVLLDPGLLLEGQVVAVAKEAYHQLRQVQQLWAFLGKRDLATVTHALLTSTLDYCNVLCGAALQVD